MAKIELIKCDRCGKTGDKNFNTVFFRTGRQTDGAGSSEDVGETLDLCSTCQSIGLSLALKHLTTVQTIELLAKIKKFNQT